MRSAALVLVLALFLPGCKSSGESATAAAFFTAWAAGGALVSRATGGCYATCPTGTACNEVTGLCDPLPCRGACRFGERCEAATNQCVAAVGPELAAEAQKKVERKQILPEEFEYDACHAIDPATGLPALPMVPASECRR